MGSHASTGTAHIARSCAGEGRAAWEQEVVGLQPRGLDPRLRGVTGSRRDLELNGSLGLVLHHDSPRGDLVAVANVADLERNEVASAELAVDAKIDQRELTYSVSPAEDELEVPRCLGA